MQTDLAPDAERHRKVSRQIDALRSDENRQPTNRPPSVRGFLLFKLTGWQGTPGEFLLRPLKPFKPLKEYFNRLYERGNDFLREADQSTAYSDTQFYDYLAYLSYRVHRLFARIWSYLLYI